MTRNELLTLAGREADRLTAENDHGAAIIMNALCEMLRGEPRCCGQLEDLVARKIDEAFARRDAKVAEQLAAHQKRFG